MQFSYDFIEALQAVIREQNFSKAAKVLRITQPAVSQRIKALEDQVGSLLLIRETPLRPTPLGRKLLEHLHQVQLLERELTSDGEKSVAERYPVAVGVNADSLATWFGEVVRSVGRENRLLLELIVDDQDYTEELLRKGEVIGCVGSVNNPPQGCDSIYLGAMRYVCAASKEFAAKYFSRGFSKSAVQGAPMVVFNRKDDMHNKFFRQELGGNLELTTHYIPSPQALLEAVVDGVGFSLLPAIQADPLVKSKRLKILSERRAEVKLYWHYRRFHAELGRNLTDKIVSAARKQLS